MQLADPLAKPIWPVTSESQQQVVSTILKGQAAIRPDGLKFGFNEVMLALENKESIKAIFVARSDITAIESFPLALASAAHSLSLVTIPKGSSEHIKASVLAITSDYVDQRVLKIAEEVGCVKMDWVYKGAELLRLKNKKANTKEKKMNKTVDSGSSKVNKKQRSGKDMQVKANVKDKQRK